MGLDIVELVVAIEDEFKISIPNAAAARLVRVGDFHAYLVEALRDRGGADADPDRIWERLKQVFIEECAIREDWITPEAHIVEDFGMD